jgi:hypothetical protein
MPKRFWPHKKMIAGGDSAIGPRTTDRSTAGITRRLLKY